MNERAKIITEQALALPREEREVIYRALAESLGKSDESVDEGTTRLKTGLQLTTDGKFLP
jgi:hypothetical protein